MIYIWVWIFLFGDVEGKGGGGGFRGGGGGGGGIFSAWTFSVFIILVIVSILCGGCCGFWGCFYWLGKFNENRQKKNVQAVKQIERDAK